MEGVYGTVDGPATRSVPLVGVGPGTAVTEAWILSLSAWKLADASADAVALTETLVLVVVGVDVNERVVVVEATLTEMYISMYQ